MFQIGLPQDLAVIVKLNSLFLKSHCTSNMSLHYLVKYVALV